MTSMGLKVGPIIAIAAPMKLLICGAFAPEIAQLQHHYEDNPSIIVAPVGIGAIAAASTTTALIAQHAPSHILFTGTCGILTPSPLSIGEVVRAKTIHLGDIGALAGDNHLPEAMTTPITSIHFLDSQNSIPERDVFCPLAITHSETGAALLRQNFPGGCVENLECFAVAWAATQNRLPFEAILGISNTIGPNGHAEWKTHHERVSGVTQKQIILFVRP